MTGRVGSVARTVSIIASVTGPVEASFPIDHMTIEAWLRSRSTKRSDRSHSIGRKRSSAAGRSAAPVPSSPQVESTWKPCVSKSPSQITYSPASSHTSRKRWWGG